MSPFLWTGTTFVFFHSVVNFPLSKKDWKINIRGLQIEISHILIVRILIISCTWALFGSRFLIIFRISSAEKVIADRDLHVFFFLRVAGKSLLFVTIEHWPANKLLKILAFSLKSVANLSWCRKVFNIDQYDFWLVLGSNNFWDKRM